MDGGKQRRQASSLLGITQAGAVKHLPDSLGVLHSPGTNRYPCVSQQVLGPARDSTLTSSDQLVLQFLVWQINLNMSILFLDSRRIIADFE